MTMPKDALPNTVYIQRKRIELIQYLGMPPQIVNEIIREGKTLGQIVEEVKGYYQSQ